MGKHSFEKHIRVSKMQPGFRGGRGGGAPYNDHNEEAPPKKGTVFRLQVYKRVGIPRNGL